MSLLIPVSWGELFDKLTILEIKSTRITDSIKLGNIRKELNLLSDIAKQVELHNDIDKVAFGDATSRLREVNESLWDIEDEIRDCEREKNFGSRFIELARAVYKINDKRAALKYRINELLGSELVEEKSYKEY